MIICIPSYKRANNFKTIDFLEDAFSKDEIIVGTQTDEDFKAYSSLYSDRATIIQREAHSCGENRNNLLDFCEEQGIKEVLFLDDDISYIRTMYDERFKGNSFKKLMEQCFTFARNQNIVLFGSYVSDCLPQMKKTVSRTIIDGMLCGILDTSIRYDISFTTKSDYELSLRLMLQGRKVCRFNSFAPKADSFSKGGCEELRSNNEGYILNAQLLVDAYPDLIKMNPNRIGEIKFIGK